MFFNQLEIGPEAKARAIVDMDYRAADVFRRYDIDFCCGLQWPLQQVCDIKGIFIDDLLSDLRKTCRTINIPSGTPYEKWTVDFLIDYIVNVHHQYLYISLPALESHLQRFISEHGRRYPHFNELLEEFLELANAIMPHLNLEETSIFPYLRQVAHVFDDHGNSFASLLVKTLRKPLADFADREHATMEAKLRRFREITGNYSAPPGACSSHRVLLEKIKELDNDLTQHSYLENTILIPKVITMEQELLNRIH